VFFLEELTTQIELYSEVLRDTALIRVLRFDVEDQLFQYIGGLDLDENDDGEDYDGDNDKDGDDKEERGDQRGSSKVDVRSSSMSSGSSGSSSGSVVKIGRKETTRDRYMRQQNKQLHCMQSSLVFDVNGPELSSAYAKVTI
jgi:hypothetical protein